MNQLIFIIAIASGLVFGVLLLLTLVVPAFRFWPPPARHSWQYYLAWTLTYVCGISTLTLGVLNGNTGFYDHWSRSLIGGFLMLGGFGFALWGVAYLGVHNSLGLKGGLVTGGPYRYSRNPQYVGDIIGIVGFALFCNARLAYAPSAIGIALFTFAPFVEEPWLRARFGSVYDAYLARTSRFIGLSSDEAA